MLPIGGPLIGGIPCGGIPIEAPLIGGIPCGGIPIGCGVMTADFFLKKGVIQSFGVVGQNKT